MKPIIEPGQHDFDDRASCAIQITSPEIKLDASSNTEASKRFRRLQANELVSRGDFVTDDHQAFELWEGPTGFRADAFMKAVYRRDESGSLAASETK